MRVLDLFSGIGGFSLGLERAGMTTVAFCEIEPYCQRVLAKHWPGIPIYDDVKGLTADALRRDGIDVDLIAGGFPCQDISVAGRGAGLTGERSGLWFEMWRIIRDVRPRWIIIENVPAILARGGSVVTNHLAQIGYDCFWECIPASAVGAPHRRDRWWCIAYASSRGREKLFDGDGKHEILSNQDGATQKDQWKRQGRVGGSEPVCAAHVANTNSSRRQARNGNISSARHGNSSAASGGDVICDADRQRLEVGEGVSSDDVEKFAPSLGTGWWDVEPDVGRVASGIPARVDRLRGLGNSVVPQIPEMVGRAIMEAAE